MIELTDAEMQRLLAQFELGSKPTPKLNALPTTVAKVKAFWGEGLSLSAEMIKNLWRKLHTQKSAAVLNRLEMRSLGRVLFTKVAQELYPLCQEIDTFQAAIDLLSKQSDKQVNLLFAKLYFRHFPNPETTPSEVYQTVQAWAENSHPLQDPVDLVYYSEYGPKKAAGLIRAGETVAEGVSRLTHGAVDADSAFTLLTWVETIPQYREKMRVSSTDLNVFMDFVDLLKREVLVEGQFRSPQHLLPFTESLLGYFLDNPSQSPDLAIQHEIINFFESFLGDRKDSANSLLWQPIFRLVDDLFNHWAIGRKLDNIFSFTLHVIKQKHSVEATKHWENRRPFWMAYWRAGRVKACRLYVPHAKVQDYRAKYGRIYPDITNDLGTISRRSQTNIMLMLELDNDLVVTEFSDNGKLRIGHKTYAINTRRSKVDWEDIMDYPKVAIAHTSRWKNNAHLAISELSGLRPPR